MCCYFFQKNAAVTVSPPITSPWIYAWLQSWQTNSPCSSRWLTMAWVMSPWSTRHDMCARLVHCRHMTCTRHCGVVSSTMRHSLSSIHSWHMRSADSIAGTISQWIHVHLFRKSSTVPWELVSLNSESSDTSLNATVLASLPKSSNSWWSWSDSLEDIFEQVTFQHGIQADHVLTGCSHFTQRIWLAPVHTSNLPPLTLKKKLTCYDV